MSSPLTPPLEPVELTVSLPSTQSDSTRCAAMVVAPGLDWLVRTTVSTSDALTSCKGTRRQVS